MTRLRWESIPNLEMGVDHVVLYSLGASGVVWNGVTTVHEDEVGGDLQTRYIDGAKSRARKTRGSFEGSIEAFTYPDILEQSRNQAFGFTYRVMKGDAYKIHLVYNARFSPGKITSKQFAVDLTTWDFSSKSVDVPDAERSAHLIIDTELAYPETVAALEDILYGSNATDSSWPTPEEVLQVFEDHAIVRVTEHDDGTFTVEGPDDVVYMLDDTTFEIAWPSVVLIDANNYRIQSL